MQFSSDHSVISFPFSKNNYMQAFMRKMSNRGEKKKSRVCHLDKTRLFQSTFFIL